MKKFIFFIMISTILTSSCNSNTKNVRGQITEGYIEVTGGKIWYKIVGADKRGTPLLVVHGGPGAPHDYLETLEALADKRPVIFYDQLGCGNSDLPTDTLLWKIERFVEEIVIIRRELKLEKIHLLGQSWGAMLATEYIIRENPEGILSLTLSGPLLSSPRWIADQNRLVTLLPENIQNTIKHCEQAEDYSSQEYQNAIQEYYKKHLCRINPLPEPMNRTNSKMAVNIYLYMWGPSEFCATGTLKDADLTGELHKIKVPVLLTCGEFDEATPESVRYFQSKIPGSKIHIMKDCSHSHHLENPKEYIKITEDFLKSNDK
ncbi:MAG: proline iminopeptidase-family hydrolase [Bacteroidales bacterium]|nr:proline iminopeptidase-family hydrolase [Bacteroidales bacterium]